MTDPLTADRRTLLCGFGATTLLFLSGCGGGVGSGPTIDSYISIYNERTEPVTAEVHISNETLDTTVLDETISVPAEDHHRSDFVTERNDEGDAVLVATLRNPDYHGGGDSEASHRLSFTSGILGFSGTIRSNGAVGLGHAAV